VGGTLAPTQLERDVLAWIADHGGSSVLRRQLEAVAIVGREFTGCGFFVDLSVPASLPRLGEGDLPAGTRSKGPLGGPYLDGPGLEAGGGSLLFLENGAPCLLELYAYGDTFPEDLQDYTLRAS